MCRNRLCVLCLALCVIVIGALWVAAPAETKKAEAVPLDKDPNLQGWWKFDDARGTTAADSSKHDRKGTLKGKLSFDKNSAAGRTGKALQFDGRGYVEITGYKGVTGTHTRTVAAWIKTKRSRGQITSWGARDFGQMWTYGFIRGRVGLTPHGGYLYMNAQTHDDKWHHVAIVVNKVELPNLHDDVKLYLDGEAAVIHDIGLLDLWPIQTGKEFDVTIGKGFSGLIDDLRIYDRPLSVDEVKVLFKLQSDKPLVKS